MPDHSPELQQRFAERVTRTDGCWWWNGQPDAYGYGRFRYTTPDGDSRVVAAHIFAWEAAQPPGTIHDDATVRMHECDHTLCVRVGPGHVTAGTQRENIAHADRLGRRSGRTPVIRTSLRERALRERDTAIGTAPEQSGDALF